MTGFFCIITMHSYTHLSISIGKEPNMIPWQELLALAAGLMLVSAVRAASRKRRDRKFREKLRKLELVLQPRETIKAICPQKKGRVILTSRRVLFETTQGFTAVEIKSIKRVQGNNEKGNRTTSIPKMVSLTIKADSDYMIKNDCEEFPEFAKQLIKKTTKKKSKP